MEQLKQREAQRQQDFAVLEEIGTAFKDVPPEEIEREGARAIAEVRSEKRRPQAKSTQKP